MKFLVLNDDGKVILNTLLEHIKKTNTEINLVSVIQEILGDDAKKKEESIATLMAIVGQNIAVEKKQHAIFLLGFCYRFVLDTNTKDETKKNNEEAFKLFSQIAKVSFFAQNEIGLMFELGKVVVQSSEKAFEWYLNATKEKYAPALHNLAKLYENKQDIKTAADLYQSAMRLGYLKSQCNYAILLMQSKEDVAKNKELARKLFNDAAQKGSVKAVDELQKIYGKELNEHFDKLEKIENLDKKSLEEPGKEKRCKEIATWVKEIVTGINDLEDLKIQKETAKGYKERLMKVIIDVIDKFEAFEWKKELIILLDQQQPPSQCNLQVVLYVKLARFYEVGLNDLPVDDDESSRWYIKAANLGDIEARKKTQELDKKIASRESKKPEDKGTVQTIYVPQFKGELSSNAVGSMQLVQGKIDDAVQDYTDVDGVRFHS